MDDDYRIKMDLESKDYKNNIFTQKFHYFAEEPSVPQTTSDSEVQVKKSELPHEVTLDLHSKKGKQISLAWFASKVDKWKDCIKFPIIIIYGLILLSFILATAAFVMALHRCFPTCPDGWKNFHEKCYNCSSRKAAWKNARKHCQVEGADLAVINREEEQDLLVYMMSFKKLHWIGFSDLKKEGIWRNWYTGKPKNDVDEKPENCAALQKKYNFTVNNLPCDIKYNYICKKNTQLACVWQSLLISY